MESIAPRGGVPSCRVPKRISGLAESTSGAFAEIERGRVTRLRIADNPSCCVTGRGQSRLSPGWSAMSVMRWGEASIA